MKKNFSESELTPSKLTEENKKQGGHKDQKIEDFFVKIARQLYSQNYKIEGINLFSFENFIEAKYHETDLKGEIFYANLIHAMPKVGGKIADKLKGENPTYQEKIFTAVFNYCKNKIEEINLLNNSLAGIDMLEALLDNNSEFNNLLVELEKKIVVTSKIIERNEFINAEIERVKKEYSQSKIEVRFENPHFVTASFDYSKYEKYAYDWLQRGANFPINTVLKNARTEFENAYKKYPQIISHAYSTGQFDKSIIDNLKKGAAWLLYIRYLHDLLGNTIPAQIDQLKKDDKNNGEDFISSQLINRLKEIETKISNLIALWGEGRKKIQCAAFVELLMDKNYFDSSYKIANLKNCESFAKQRYNAEIKVQMLPKEKMNREKHKKFLEKYFIK